MRICMCVYIYIYIYISLSSWSWKLELQSISSRTDFFLNNGTRAIHRPTTN